jgi:ubiquitin carboxyl-terminal hydrolase L5
MDESGWCLTESDPQVFTQLLKDLGVQGLQVVSRALSTSRGLWIEQSTLVLWSGRLVGTPKAIKLRSRHRLRGVLILQDDLYSLDASTLSTLQPIHALIFLFKHVGYGDATTEAGVEVDPQETGVWFANQVCIISISLHELASAIHASGPPGGLTRAAYAVPDEAPYEHRNGNV